MELKRGSCPSTISPLPVEATALCALVLHMAPLSYFFSPMVTVAGVLQGDMHVTYILQNATTDACDACFIAIHGMREVSVSPPHMH
jgi:hypothetical protein